MIAEPETRLKATGKPEPVVNSATVQGQEPWMVNEKYNAPGRGIARKSALEALDKPKLNEQRWATPVKKSR